MKKPKMTTEHAVKKEFNFVKDGVNLAFTLRVDIKNQLIAFEELLVAALAEVRAEIER